jgi:hypothetical protein
MTARNTNKFDDNPRNAKMPTDRYTKVILTMIAISLAAIALRSFVSPGLAGAEMSGCGLDAHHPCYIAGWGPEGTVPIANSAHFPLKILVGNLTSNPMPVIVVNGPQPMFHP